MIKFILTKYIFVLNILFLSAVLSAQTYEVVYDLKYQPNIDVDSLVVEEMSLLFNVAQQKSIFENLGKQKIKEFYKNLRQSAQLGNSIHHDISLMPTYNFAFSVLKDFENQKYTFYEAVLGETYTYEFKEPINWEILNSTKEVMGYQCQEAQLNFGGRTWLAYFTHEIPFSDGPYKFYGLPGLILEVQSTDGDYSFEATSIYTLNKDIIQPDAIVFKKDKLDQYKERLAEKPSIALKNKLESSNISISVKFDGKNLSGKSFEDTYDKEVKEWMKNHNNPIEKDMIWLEK